MHCTYQISLSNDTTKYYDKKTFPEWHRVRDIYKYFKSGTLYKNFKISADTASLADDGETATVTLQKTFNVTSSRE